MNHHHKKKHAVAFGIDIGGSGIKGAPVDLAAGEFSADRVRIPTPLPATPDAVSATVAEVVASFDLDTDVPIGVTFPAVILHGVAQSAANVDKSWIGTDVEAAVGAATGRRVVAVNDADAAGYAEVRYGAAKDVDGVVLVVTLGTGIGSALVVDGRLVPNTELGHLEIDGFDAESRAADSARDREDLDWATWAQRLQRYFTVVENLFWPDLIVVGGGVSKHHQQFLPLLDLRTRIVPAELRNAAGIVGAAALAARAH
ncbi:polyphosphate--glucose phosphotransferase [Cellulomonas fimi]|uniref:ROK family protein n=1 Tax=Cellulomonas fimi (strain ATCC 484 / DSM 20113 / JCM 1341 / CCUG 24087 / LMG 16345 / NBRC 15513 / NCIMB 8980 / NCTC 7547 / NRS-133) TaxID=590998 RepID=F4H275_CELFA|nr:ROK family protein [Cellulomonas fimi]AEE46372.1 ROK family protein [Cellulomonas fimi ATCC 484]NNH07172.1 ROK family protein [Cellulomonas fimi]VEH32728.1 Polyphosphate glucokinase [Cellulomonas fimi]